LKDVISENPHMARYIKDFDDCEQITRIVTDFLVIAEHSGTSFILVAMVFRAFDKATLEAILESTLEATLHRSS